MSQNIPRRCFIDKLTPGEKAIYDAIVEVEKIPGDVRLTEVSAMLARAKDLLSDFIDNQ